MGAQLASIVPAAADGIVLVVAVGQTRPRDVLRTKAILERAGTPILGVVLNRTPVKQLNSYYKATGQPDYFQKDLDRYRALTAADIKAAVEKYLPKDRRVELSVVPGEKK